MGPGVTRLGFTASQQVEREPYDLLSGERKGPDGHKLGRAPANAGKAVEIYKGLVAAEPGADDHRRAEALTAGLLAEVDVILCEANDAALAEVYPKHVGTISRPYLGKLP